jgi:ubiquinone/menaquinone biosynthesis C-methylase UbiE
VAEVLARRVGLSGQVDYRHASALALPFPSVTFAGAYMIHVGMNIAAKQEVFAEARRVLRQGGVFAVYDVMRDDGDSELLYPVPWAAAAETSFVDAPETYARLLEAAGFRVTKQRNRRDFAIEFFRQMRARAAQSGGPPPLGLHLLMGASAPQKIANMVANLEQGLIAPIEIVARAI